MTEGKQERRDDNVIYIGKKPSMAYVLAVVTQFGSGTNEIVIKARGKAISKAVDVAEIVRNKFAQDAKVTGIEIGTEKLETETKEMINVSTMSIKLKK